MERNKSFSNKRLSYLKSPFDQVQSAKTSNKMGYNIYEHCRRSKRTDYLFWYKYYDTGKLLNSSYLLPPSWSAQLENEWSLNFEVVNDNLIRLSTMLPMSVRREKNILAATNDNITENRSMTAWRIC
jgi:hypothetical protein